MKDTTDTSEYSSTTIHVTAEQPWDEAAKEDDAFRVVINCAPLRKVADAIKDVGFGLLIIAFAITFHGCMTWSRLS